MIPLANVLTSMAHQRNILMLVLVRVPGENLSEQSREPTNSTWPTSAQVDQGDNLFPINPAGSSSIVSSSYIPANRGE